MQTSELVSVGEYLSTSYRPDVDYVDGMLLERNAGELDHARLQMALSAFFYNRREQWGIHIFPEQRVQVSATHFRVPDICVVLGAEPEEQIFTSPPFICVEILSKDDRMSQMQDRVDDYLAFGVHYIWILDPRKRKAFRCTPGEIREIAELRTENPEILIPLDAIFAG